jgi:hypothetical protein
VTAFDALAPYMAAVGRAQAALDTHNRNPEAHPLDGLPLVGRVIRHQHAALDAALNALRYADPCNSTTTEMRLRGQLNRLAATQLT